MSFADQHVYFVPTPQNIRLSNAGQTVFSNNYIAGLWPSNAVAIIATITTWATNSDAIVHTLGRNASHQTLTWDNGPYSANAYLNDV